MEQRLTTALQRAARVIGRPARVDAGSGGLVVHPYRGYGNRRQVVVTGRVFHQDPAVESRPQRPWRADLGNLWRRLTRRGAGGVTLEARLYGSEKRFTTDRRGYFHLLLLLKEPPPPDRGWHSVQLRIIDPELPTATAWARVFVPPMSTGFAVISDIDDTVVYTGVANKLRMFWRLFMTSAESREAFAGVAPFYRALHHGPTGHQSNPMLYVSRGPWSIYEILDRFFHLHRIPVGPVLFLRDWGLSIAHPLPRSAKGHKLALIRDMLTLYSDIPFILIGDSGQHDPEVYARVVREHPGRVKAVYIRNVSRRRSRVREIEALAKEVAQAGSTLLLAADSAAMAEHAAVHDLIPATAVDQVRAAREAQGAGPEQPRHKLFGRKGKQAAIAAGRVGRSIGKNGGNPPNVDLEPSRHRPARRNARRLGNHDSS